MDVNEYERLFSITLMTKIKVKDQSFYCFFIFHSYHIKTVLTGNTQFWYIMNDNITLEEEIYTALPQF